MGLFSFLNRKNESGNAAISMLPVINPVEQAEEEVSSVMTTTEQESSENKPLTVSYATGWPIDIIYGYLHKNYEEDGFQDALINSDITYRDAKEKIIRNDLEMLFKRIVLKYRSDIRMVNVRIDNAQKALALAAASDMAALRETYEEHLTEIQEMQQQLEANDPKMTTMIESYRRGFLKGIAANAVNFINNK